MGKTGLSDIFGQYYYLSCTFRTIVVNNKLHSNLLLIHLPVVLLYGTTIGKCIRYKNKKQNKTKYNLWFRSSKLFWPLRAISVIIYTIQPSFTQSNPWICPWHLYSAKQNGEFQLISKTTSDSNRKCNLINLNRFRPAVHWRFTKIKSFNGILNQHQWMQ